MKSREKLLAIGVASLLALMGLCALMNYVNDSFDDRDRQLAAAQKTLRDKNEAVRIGLAASKLLKGWSDRSLPADRRTATSLYQKWLLEIAKSSGVHQVNILTEANRGQVEGRRTRDAVPLPYEQVGFRIDAEGTLAHIVRLLYHFHAANHLHRIGSLEITPVNNKGDLSLSLRIEALIMVGTPRTDSLNSEKSNRLSFGDLAAYEKAIVGRNVFAEYVPPKPPVVERRVVDTPPRRDPPKPPAFDQAKHATITGITEQNNQPQLWLSVKTTGEQFKLAEGEEFSVGDMKCKVIRIGLRDAELESGDKTFVVRLKDNLRDAATTKSGEL